MKENSLHIPRLLNRVTYIGITAMSFLGISRITSFHLQFIAFGLCFLSGLIYHLYFTKNSFWQKPKRFFGTQTFILALLFLIDSNTTDAFNFLFLLLAIHTAVVLPYQLAVVWITVYFVIVNSIVLFVHGTYGIYSFLFYLITYGICGFFGYTLQQTEIARDRNQKLVDELKEMQQKLQELAVVEERNRLARDLHDSVKQRVFAISMQLSAARTALSESDKAYQSVIEAEKLAQQAGVELTTLINALRPPELGDKLLAEAVREYVDEWSRQNHIKTESKIDSKSTVNEKAEQALFRVLQEALANVSRHSQADKVIVELKSENDIVILIVEDNGIGFDKNQINKGIGLDSMQERLTSINGNIEVISEKSKGTRIIARVRKS